MKRFKNNLGMIRVTTVGLLVLAQLLLIAVLVIKLRQNYVYLFFILEIIGLVEVILLSDKNLSSEYSVAWVIVILILPVFGNVLFLLWGMTPTNSKKSKMTRQILMQGVKELEGDHREEEQLEKRYPDRKNIARYLKKEGFPLYTNTQSKYYSIGELQFEEMIEDMKKAEKFIFMTYFIIGEGKVWSIINDVLKMKANQGVEIRILYDDFGSITKVPKNFIKDLKNEKIRVIAFNPVHKHISNLYLNYRSHQKITVIDGNIGYTGGANIADEYANLIKIHGHWKDTAIRIEGDAVWSLTVTFLQMWQSENIVAEDYSIYKPTYKKTGDGFYQPFSDGPVNHPHNPAEITYRRMICSARKYVYITTPYLITDDSMAGDLCLAAQTGTDVRIITPKIWDKWYVHMVTRSNYHKLLEAGVRIFEYTPGYIHAKTIISDDDHAITGSINLDYRSFFLHFENGVWICGAPILRDMKRDITETINKSEEVTIEQLNAQHWYLKVAQTFLRIFAPFL